MILNNFVELCEYRAKADADQLAYRYLNRREGDKQLTFGQLDSAARLLAARLAASGARGDRVLIICPQSMDYATAFFGCLYGGFIAVPAYAPRNNHHVERLQAIIADARPSILLLCRKQLASVAAFIDSSPALQAMTVVIVDELPAASDTSTTSDWHAPPLGRDDIAFLQYTSGSTDTPKGIMVSHGNLLANEEMIMRTCGNHAGTRTLLWLPLFHDMGLMTLLQGVYAGYATYLMAPMDFLANPLSWLQAVARLKATLTVAPNFAWQLCADKVTPAQLAELDLSCLQVAISGSEPVAVATLENFSAAFAACGFRQEMFRPCYGLAEATLIVTGSQGVQADAIVEQSMLTAGRSQVFRRVSCGRPVDGCGVAVVDPDSGQVRPAGEVGEIWVKGAHVAQGYWNRPDQSTQTFANYTADGAGPFLRTGDLGFFHQEELVVTGRSKDVIIVRGDNYYPSDLEASAVQAHPDVIQDGAAAFALDDDGPAAACIVAELRRQSASALYPHIAQAIITRISAAYGLTLARVVLIKERSVPKTSSGKVQRSGTRAALAQGQLKVLWDSHAGVADSTVVAGPAASPYAELQALLASAQGEVREQIINGFLLSLIADTLKVPFYAIDRTRPVTALGLDSLALMQLKHRIGEALQVDVPADLLFSDANLADVVAAVGGLTQDTDPVVPTGAPLAAGASPWPATAGQAALWLIQQAERASHAYNEGFVARVDGALDRDLLAQALRALAARHDALRVRFVEVDGQPMADSADACDLAMSSHADDAQALQAARAALTLPFDLRQYSWRCIMTTGPGAAYLTLAIHHIAVDLWSFDLLIEELKQHYLSLLRGRGLPAPLSAPAPSYAAFSAWQRDWLGSSEAQQQLAYWRSRLSAMPARSSFSAVSAEAGPPTGGKHRFALDRVTVQGLRSFARQHGLTTYQVLFGACALLLGRYAGQNEVVLGMPTLGRRRTVDAATIGYFANVLPIRVALADHLAVDEWAVAVQEAVLGGIRHQDIPLPVLSAALAVPGQGANPLVQVVFSLLQTRTGQGQSAAHADRLLPFVLGEEGGQLSLGDAVLTSIDPQRLRAQFDLSFAMVEDEAGLRGSVEYRADLYTQAMVARLAANFACAIRELVGGQHQRLGDVPYIDAAEQAGIRCSLDGGANAVGWAAQGVAVTVVDWFRQAAMKHAGRLALHSDQLTLNYEQLDRESDILAQWLIEKGTAAGDRVAIAVTSRAWQAVMALAVLKAGAVYVPVDLSYPAERIAFMLGNSGTAFVLSTRDAAARLPATALSVLLADELGQAAKAFYAARGIPRIALTEGQAAYCIYTSGSTGQPKGVLVTHAGLKNLVEWHIDAFAVDTTARAALLAGPGFDAAVWESWPYLCAGASLAEPAAHCKRDMTALSGWLTQQAISHCFMPTPLAESFLVESGHAGQGTLRYLLTGGDQLKTRPRTAQGFHLVNAYGPTENTVVTTSGAVEPAGESESAANIGARPARLPDIGLPIRGQVLYILDAQLRVLPRGVSGELFVSGAGLALGYHGSPALTAARFIPNPYAARPGARMYGSGDIVRLDDAGRLHFLGRNDDQVQVRGYRIELGEVEALLAAHPQVKQCKVIAQEHGQVGRQLAAYVAGDGKLGEPAVRAYLGAKLPPHMVPAVIVVVDALALDSNGKINRHLLPRPAPSGAPDAALFAHPYEQEIAAVYHEVLGCGTVCAGDNFFSLGGHSLLVARVAAGIRAQLGIAVSIADIFSFPTVSALAAHLRSMGQAVTPLTRAARTQRLPLSPEQQRLWLLQELDPDSTDYNICGAVRVTGALDLDRLAAAMTMLAAKHELLRSCFVKEHGQPWQTIQAPQPVHIEILSLDAPAVDGAHDTLDAAVFARIDAWEAHCFNLETGPLFKLGFLPVARDDGYLLLNMHHIVADGRSIVILFEELDACYAGLAAGLAPVAQADDQALQYADYSLWSQSDAVRGRDAAALGFWKEKLAGELPGGLAALQIHGTGLVRSGQPALASSSGQASKGAEISRWLGAGQADAVRALALRWGVTEATVHMAAYGLLVAKYSGDGEVVLGLAYGRRDLPELSNMIGMFVNVLPIRVNFSDDGQFAQQVLQLRDACAEAFRHGHVSYAQLVELAGRARGDGTAELIKTMFDFEQHNTLPATLGDTRLDLLRRADRSAKFDLTLRCSPAGDGSMRIGLNYRRALFSDAMAGYLLDAYLLILEQVVQSPQATLATLRLTCAAGREALLQLGHGRQTALDERPVFLQFEQAARDYPQRLALVADTGAAMSYSELNAAANRLARYLAGRGVQNGATAALCLPPGPSFVTAALALLKLGAAYVPVDPRYPDQRKERIFSDSAARLVIADAASAPGQLPDSCALVSLDGALAASAALADSNLDSNATPDDVAYIVYTSGTTGLPKGVAIPHRGLANLCQWHRRAYGLTTARAEVRASQSAGIGFDAAVWEIWPYLCAGASVWFVPEAERQSSRPLVQWLIGNAITHCFLVTPLAHAVMADGWTGSASLQFLLTGGERLTSHAPAGASYRLVNHYGPSENSVVATAGEVGPAADAGLPSIGAPIDNVSVYVLDRHAQLMPRGAVGELYIGGASLMRGYRADEALTGDKLVADPFSTVPDARMYRTGDLVCWNGAATLDYIGRVDQQVKIRGYRVELGEIIQVIKAQPGVQDAVVTALPHDRQGVRLVAYVVFENNNGDGLSPAARLTLQIGAHLPQFMVPGFIIEMDALPLTSNGKVDYASLPAPRQDASVPRVALRTVTEHALADIWGTLLGEPVTDAQANFFALGGHSLLAARAVSLIETRLGRDIALKDFFGAGDLAALARQLDESAAYAPIALAQPEQRTPLSPYQKRLWLMQAFQRNSVDYNVVGALRIDGVLDTALFRAALSAVVERHQILRTRVLEEEGDAYQELLAPGAVAGEAWPLNLLQVNLSGNPQQIQASFVQDYLARLAVEPFDLASGQLFKLVLIQTAADTSVLAASFHHIIVDAWSAQVFLRDLLACYAAQLGGRAADLRPLAIQYRDYSLWAKRQLSQAQDSLFDFWRGYLHALPAQAPLPVAPDAANPVRRSGRTLTLAWPADTAAQLKALARQQHASLYEVLITSYFIWLHRLSGQADFMVGMPFNDRGRPELEDLVGFFVNMLPVRARINPHASYLDLLRQTQQNLHQVYAHHALPFDQIAQQCTQGADQLFQTVFDFQSALLVREDAAQHSGLSVALMDGAPEAPVAALSVTFSETAAGLVLSCNYVDELFDSHTVTRWLENYRLLLESIASDPAAGIGALAFLTPHEMDAVERLRNSVPVDHANVFPAASDDGAHASPQLLHLLVDRQAVLWPARPALVTPAGIVSFAALAAKTNQLAHYLLEAGVRPGTVVGVQAAHSAEAVIAIIAVLKAGALCFPLDVQLAPARLALLMQDSGCRHVLTSSDCPLGDFDGQRLMLAEQAWRHCPVAPPLVDVLPGYGVFLTYTSGTTGGPKASVQHHRGLVNYIATVIERFQYRPGDRGLLFAPLTFDASIEEIFLPLCAGGSLYIGDDDVKRSVPALLETCRSEAISVLTLPTAYWRVLGEYLATQDPAAAAWGPVRLISVGGERLTIEAIRLWQRATAGQVALCNIYGPSECSIGSIVDAIDLEHTQRDDEVYLRRPVANVHLHVLDAFMNPVPAGLPGELYIGGAGVAHGYHGRPALTAERFVPDPFARGEGGRLYRSGDLVHYDLDARLHYLGRADFQVKVDGIRIEPEEIALVLESHPTVAQAIVLAEAGRQLRNPLIGYVTLDKSSEQWVAAGTDGTVFVDYVRQRLPAHMVPARVVVLEAFPLTVNQKVDRRALLLAANDPSAPPASVAAVATTSLNPTETALLALWHELLGSDSFGADDNFFSLGGNSLLAIRINNRVEALYAVRLPVAALFESPTVRGLALLVDRLRAQRDDAQVGTGTRHGPTWRAEPVIERIAATSLALSGAQYRLWYLHQMAPDSTAYNLPDLLRLEGALDRQRLRLALEHTVHTHESLRTIFVVDAETPMQVVVAPDCSPLVEVDLSALSRADAEQALAALVLTALETPFDLAEAPLARFSLVRVEPHVHVLVSIFHHIIVDGWSVGLFQQTLAEHYNRAGNGALPVFSSDHAPRPLQYRDFTVWQRRMLDEGERVRQLAYWRAQLDGQLPTLQLPTDFNRPQQLSQRGSAFAFELDETLSRQLELVSERHQVSMFMLLLAAYAAVLARYDRQEELLVGVPALGRGRPEWEAVLGFFVNTLVIRIRTGRALTFAALLKQVRQTCLDAFAHQDVALEEIAADINPLRERDGSGLFRTMFSYQDADALALPVFDALEASSIEPDHYTAKFDLYLATWRQGRRLHCGFEFSADLFEEATVRRMADHFTNLLGGIARETGSLLRALPLLSAAEQEHQLRGLNQTALVFPEPRYVRDIFARQAALHPQRIAVNCAAEAMTYSELDRASGLVAHNLLASGARDEDLIGLLLGRNINYLVAMLGVLKAGVAFTPLNAEDPVTKLDRIVDIGKVRYVLCEAATRDKAGQLAARVPLLELGALPYAAPAHSLPGLPVTPSSLAYVIYTSGSTGQPKGAMIEQQGMRNHLLAKIRDLAVDQNDVIAEMAVNTFDVSVWQYLLALLVGGRTAVMPGDAAWDPQQLLAQMAVDGVTLFESVPSHMKILIDELEMSPGRYRLDRLRLYVSNAEALTPALCARWFACLPHIPVVNTYGATECSDDTSHLWIRAPLTGSFPYVPIQGTLPNLQTYLLDAQMRPVPMGVVGEVYLGGVGVGRGYLGEPVRTAETFLPDPFSAEPGRRIYKTGDLARYRPGDVLEFVGREDFQIKIRGQRVEIGEVEKAIGEHDNVRQAVVVAARDDKDRLYLLAYVIPHVHPAPTSGELRSFVGQRVAGYMVPAWFVLMDEFPLNANGKIERKRLPKPSDLDIFNRHDYVAPKGATEERLVLLWQEQFGVDRIGALDSFFELGGHSLLAAELVLRIRTLFGVALPLRTLFQTPQLRAVAHAIDGLRATVAVVVPASIEKLPPRAHYELAPCQVPEWYAYQMDPASPVYNISIADLFFTGKLDRAAFLSAWSHILDRHEVLRVTFDYRDGAPVQIVDPSIVLRAEDVFLDRSTLAGRDAIDEANRLGARFGTAPFDFANGPLFRLHVASYAGDFHQMIFVVHHIIWDEGSLINLMLELSELYNAVLAGRVANVPVLEVSYFDYVQWTHQQLRSGAFDEHKQYWLTMYAQLPPPLDLPTDYPRPNLMSYQGDALRTWLPRKVVRKIEAFLKKNDVTLFMLQLAILDYYLYRISGQADFVIGCPIAGRADDKLKPLFGLFATPMPIRCTIDAGMTFGALLAQVSQRSLEAFEHYHYPSNLVIEQLQHEKDLSRPKLFSIMYGVQNNKTDLMGRLQFDGLTLSLEDVVDTENKSSRFDLNFVVDQFGSDVMFSCIYNADLFHRSSVELMLENMTVLMGQVLDDPDLPLHAYTMVEADGKEAAVVCGDPVAYDKQATMHSLMAAQASSTPERTAIVADGVSYTYHQLNTRANQLAHYLLSLGVEQGDKVAVMLDPTFDMIAGLYSILKAGACFVPIGAQYPHKRVTAILRNSGARWVLTDSAKRRAFNAFPHAVVCIDEVGAALAGYAAGNPAAAQAGQLAYILHTSGSSGVPKGIEIEHAGVTNMLADIQANYGLTGDDRVLFHTPFTFDVFIQDVFWPLAYGAAVVVMADDAAKSGKGYGDMVERERITVLQFVPAMLEALIEAREQGQVGALPSLRQVICGAAALYRTLVERFARVFSCSLANHYGPTEVTVDACRFDCSGAFVGDTVPIGSPVGNATVLILDQHRQAVARGIIGEIHVASPGLARGYLNDDAATAGAFIKHEIGGVPCRLYRTGDLGRIDRDGVVYFHGRYDKQFKINGNRVELEEIASALRSHPGIAVAAIQYVEDAQGGGRLIAYVEQDSVSNQFVVPGKTAPYYSFTLAQRPELLAAVDAFPTAPSAGSTMPPAIARGTLARQFPACQLVWTDHSDALVASVAAMPMMIDVALLLGSAEPASLVQDELSRQAKGAVPNVLYVFDDGASGAMREGAPALAFMRQQCRRLAAALGVAQVVYASGVATGDPVMIEPADHGGPAHLTRDSIRAWLRESLPDYMVPNLIHFIPVVPMTDSGKIDAKNLPLIQAEARLDKQLASTVLQRELSAMWERLLKVEKVGVTDDFFVLGGQSLKAIEIVSEVNKRYGVRIPLRAFYQNPTIRYLETLLIENE
ncbi:amino acid adenylation domain-containing protein [Massilia sp. CCM 9210]|uniref:non-ribosomal peptide synthetase n=1 Tax=Massilia scottii TaxID=3057166 RepID=UPI00279646BF|nr:non-ribosomal peptide synthetase [Massilia sp. CCM 9210]MDQ1815072.1 amino acid adenylation domain-containing protein [Massilia sp. CCM 9210]